MNVVLIATNGLFVWVDALRPVKHFFFSNVGAISWVGPVLSSEDKAINTQKSPRWYIAFCRI